MATTTPSTKPYAVIQLAGKQFKVTEGMLFEVDHLDAEPASTMVITDVLLKSDGTNVQVGTPIIENASVTLELIDHSKGDKIRVFKYKSKSRYRKTYGHRQHLTTVKVATIA